MVLVVPLFIYANSHYSGTSICLKPLVNNSFISKQKTHYCSNFANFLSNGTGKNKTGTGLLPVDYVSYIKIVSLSQTEIDQRAANNIQIDDTEILQIFEFSPNLQIMSMNATIR